MRVDGDTRRLSQLLDNLLTNSRRYTDAPGRIRVSVLADANVVRLAVDDTGGGRDRHRERARRPRRSREIASSRITLKELKLYRM